MAGHTISAYTDPQTAARVEEISRREDRTTAQIAAAALRFYVNLPQEARQAFRLLEAAGDNERLRKAIQQISRILLNTEYEMACAQALVEMQVAHLDTLHTEDELLAEAVRITA
ncbi:ribbon-helix-helix domain-containing protein [Anthocerotibacter panamensis]|uniref:ribbon-helix-helix domain-containing protein n=1 Tax=Anthocerotibacter panamensis TaxID=2857077 RepID=UPI001C401AE2|nr:ribbon-helix-helix domain-containing protein [Anthocerotibacter panamensis]